MKHVITCICGDTRGTPHISAAGGAVRDVLQAEKLPVEEPLRGETDAVGAKVGREVEQVDADRDTLVCVEHYEVLTGICQYP